MQSFANLLVCLDCREPLAVSDFGFRCGKCGKVYPVIDDIPRFVDTQQYASSFGFEWKKHPKTQLDRTDQQESETTFRQKTGLTPEELKGKRVLDVGCGMGRFMDVVHRWGAQVVGCDLSIAVESARKNFANADDVFIIQADVFHLPFAAESFDLIYSLGVLHHTPDSEKAFRQLPKLLKKGGKICVWLYDPMITWGRAARFYRRFSPNISPGALYNFCRLAAPLGYVHRIPLLGRLTWRLFPTSTHPVAEWRVLDTFDYYSPKYQSVHTYPQVHDWFETEGLIEIQDHEVPVSVSGRKPL